MESVRSQSAFTLLEALIALLVLSVGLLGMATAQLESLRGAQAGYQRGLATLAAEDAVELLWSRLEAGECPSLAGDEADWLQRWREHLPGLQGRVEAGGADCRYTIRLEWPASRLLDAPQDTLVHEARLPRVAP